MNISRSVTIASLAVCACSAVSLGQLSIPWHTIDCGGGTSTGGAFSLSGTIGQHDASAPLTGGSFTLTGGFWAGVATPPACAADFNNDGDVNPDDLGDYINCYFSVPPCPEADINADGNTDPDDLGDFINVFFGGC